MRRLIFVKFLILFGAVITVSVSQRAGTLRAEESPTDEMTFREKVVPLLVTRCLACHSDKEAAGGYSMSTFDLLAKPGDSEQHPIDVRQVDNSELLRRVTTNEISERMPLDADPLSSSEIAVLRSWIASGYQPDTVDRRKPLSSLSAITSISQRVEHYPRAVAINSLTVTGEDSEVIVSGYGEITFWKVADGQLLRRIAVVGRHVKKIALSADLLTLAVSSGNPGEFGAVQLISDWQSDNPTRIHIASLSDLAADIAFAPDSQRLAIACSDGKLIVAQKESDSVRAIELVPHADGILAVAWSNDGGHLITSSRDRTAKLFETKQFHLLASYDRHERAVGGVAFINSNPITFDETGKLRLMVGDDSDRVVAETSGLVRHLEHILVDNDQVLVPDKNALCYYTVEKKKVDDGKDDEGNPKTKESTKFRELGRIKLDDTAWINSVAAGEQLWLAGTDQGEVIIVEKATSQIRYRFLAKP